MFPGRRVIQISRMHELRQLIGFIKRITVTLDMTQKVLICYGTRYGSTAEVAEEIGKTIRELGVTAEVLNLKEKRVQPSGYDLIVIGSGIQAGKWTKEPLDFMSRNREALSRTRTALFVVCGDAGVPENCERAQAEYLDKVVNSFPSLRVVSTGLFGGVFDLKKYSAPVRMLVKSILKKQAKGGNVPDKIDMRNWDKIRAWARSIA